MMHKSLLAFVLSFVFINNYANGHRAEGIVGGNDAREGEFKYQMTLKYLRTPTGNESEMACTGAIIDKFFAITVGHCVVEKSAINRLGTFKMRWYKVAVGTHDLSTNDGLLVEIEEIFVPAEFNPFTSEADLAVIKLKEALEVNGPVKLEILELPNETTVDENVDVVASGYGFSWLHRDGMGFTDFKLRYVEMHVETSQQCRKSTNRPSDSNLCVRTIPDLEGQQWGICVGDSGAPVVVDKKLLGIVYRGRKGCVDTVLPSIATRIKSHLPFIKGVLEGTPPTGTRRFTNPFAPPQTAPLISVAS